MKPGVAVFVLSAAILIAGCNGAQSALNAEGAAAVQLKHLIIAIVIVCSAVWALVMIVLILALLRSRTQRQSPSAASERRMGTLVTAAVAATVLIIAGLTIASFYATRGLGMAEDAGVTIKVRGQQWWWQFIYDDADPAKTFQTANEMHIPVGVDIRIELESTDVMHSFWVPSLAGKRDLIPGRQNTIIIRADRPGVYRGQCAEFCGLQHSHMALFVIAEDVADYQRWAAAQRGNSASPTDPEAIAGKALFMRKPCAFCHTIRGTDASGTTGPDLTHLGSRQTIAAGLLDNTRGSLAAWIADPQTLKPGNNMPMVLLSSDELRQLSAYMESLR
ncbi:cytochrome c oxidase subunit II [Rhizobium sp. CNPSo 3464]|uniref:cytochrome c oxidase subunit II n=1 Tax=Rhizobium sp. CNPSo 3464 TaxID=3021406 RepID=UPI00254C50AA|nr:cytochrome c oxidase subunit II [Rhizobium sp. CNPSo 3464]MDK4743682.1 cytochrome c oxidase subunit II [Rhizobium sp. CNPSo 3464]